VQSVVELATLPKINTEYLNDNGELKKNDGATFRFVRKEFLRDSIRKIKEGATMPLLLPF